MSARTREQGDESMREFCRRAHDLGVLGIASDAARNCGVTLVAVAGNCRTNSIRIARRAVVLAVALARPELSYPELGRLFARDHTTILHLLRGTEAARVRSERRPGRVPGG